MANEKEWAAIKHFKPAEAGWGDASKIDPFLLQFLDEFREAIGHSVIITSGYRGGDPAQHGLGKAVDFVVPSWPSGHLFDLYLMAERFGFTGIGLYKHWFHGGKMVGGLHVDTRVLLGKNNPGLKGARWTCVRPGLTDGMSFSEAMKFPQKYLPMDLKTLKDHGFI